MYGKVVLRCFVFNYALFCVIICYYVVFCAVLCCLSPVQYLCYATQLCVRLCYVLCYVVLCCVQFVFYFSSLIIYVIYAAMHSSFHVVI